MLRLENLGPLVLTLKVAFTDTFICRNGSLGNGSDEAGTLVVFALVFASVFDRRRRLKRRRELCGRVYLFMCCWYYTSARVYMDENVSSDGEELRKVSHFQISPLFGTLKTRVDEEQQQQRFK